VGEGYSRGPIQQQTKTLNSGMIKRPNKMGKPATTVCNKGTFGQLGAALTHLGLAVIFRIINSSLIITQLTCSSDTESDRQAVKATYP